MGKLQHFVNLLFTRKFLSKFTAYFLILVVFVIFRDFLGTFFLTFIFAYLFYTSAKFIKSRVDLSVCKKLKSKKAKLNFSKYFNLNIIIIIEYILFIIVLSYIISNILPNFKEEIKSITDGKESSIVGSFYHIQNQIMGIVSQIDPNNNLNLNVYINDFFAGIDLKNLGNSILNSLGILGKIIIKIFIALLLSFVFLLDRKRLKAYLKQIKKSSFSFLYTEYSIIIEKVLKSFGLIFKAQSIIAFANTVLTLFGLIIIGILNGVSFPYLLTIGLIVFIAGFIPVLGVFISSIPILIIAFSLIGGYAVVLEIVLLIIVVHMIEAYYLNPKIVSSFLKIPVSLTFIILIVSESLFGIAGLLIGISLFYFVLGLLIDINKVLKKKDKELKLKKGKK